MHVVYLYHMSRSQMQVLPWFQLVTKPEEQLPSSWFFTWCGSCLFLRPESCLLTGAFLFLFRGGGMFLRSN
jgi:hypothetical protein